MTAIGTTPGDVRVEIETDLDNNEIENILDRVARDINREYQSGVGQFQDTQHRQDFEATLTALRIATGKDPTAAREILGDWSQQYDADRVSELRSRVNGLDPGDSFGKNIIAIRDTNRYSGSADL